MRARARINLNALKHNLQQVRQLAPDSRVMSVIKANAYGHGLLKVAGALGESDAFAVASIEEALQLRKAAVTKRIVILQGVIDRDELILAAENNLDMVVHCEEQLRLLNEVELTGGVDVWLKVDTGMHRLGIHPARVAPVYAGLEQSANVTNIRLMSHFANADNPDDGLTARQLQILSETAGDIKAEKTIANSAGICVLPDCNLDWVRPGIMLYGINPFQYGRQCSCVLQPAMTVSSRFIAINNTGKGESVGYGGTWTCPKDMSVGVVAIGYGDGYPRHARTGTPVLVNGQRLPLVGRVSMDMICVDLSDCPQARVGDEVVLWGDGLPVEEVAECAGTIGYELVCKLTERVLFEYYN
ncbi:MAG TPA: alanine racemase [Gammaproteobacteria bacterium]|nr:alanine racemase [Gammaproteobacteria bacterium]